MTTEKEHRFWAAAGDAQYEAEHLAHQLWALNQETSPEDAEAVRRRADAVLATAARLAEIVARMGESRP